jgi:hypothetical protein
MGHPGSLGLLVLYDSAVSPFAQARDAAQQEEEDERADHNLRKVTINRGGTDKIIKNNLLILLFFQ